MMNVARDLSVITVCFNASKTLQRTIDSVSKYNQNKRFEYIVIDGGSTDGTLEILAANKNVIDIVVSEPDGGIYDAMNKGVHRANGEYIYFINADDWLAEGFLSIIDKLESFDLIAGCVIYHKFDGTISHRITPAIKQDNILDYSYVTTMFFPHQGLFVKKQLLMKFPFNTSYKVCADLDNILCLVEASCSFKGFDLDVAHFMEGGMSSNNHDSELYTMLSTHLTFFNSIKRTDRNFTYYSLIQNKPSVNVPVEYRNILKKFNISLFDRLKTLLLLKIKISLNYFSQKTITKKFITVIKLILNRK